MKTNFDLERSKFNLACKAMLCVTVAMLCFNIASFSNSVKVYNNTECTMEVFCDEASLGTGVFYMGELQPGQRFTIYPTAIFGEVFCKNKRTGTYVKGIEFYYGHFDLYVNKGCSEDRPEENPSTPDNTAQCDDPAFAPCINTNVLDFSQDGIDWGLNDIGGSYTVGEQTFDISVNDADGIFAAYQAVQADSDDEGSYENNTGIAIGINPHTTDDVIEINYNLSLVSDYVAFTIRDLDKKYKENSQQIEEVCVFGYLDGVEILPTITSLCGSVKINGNCAVATTNSIYGEDESIRVVFETCINEIKIVYGNAVGAANNPTYSRIFIGDDIGFGTAVCTDDCKICTAEATAITLNSDSNEVVCTNSNTPINVEAVGGNGENSAWVITDQQTNIISTTDVPPFTFNEVGNYIIWFLNWDGDLSAAPVIGANAGEIVGASTCAALSNPIEISVEECCTAEAAVLVLDEAIGNSNGDVCANSDTPINVTISGGNGENSAWVVTDQQTNIISTTDVPPFTFNEVGNYIIWFLNWDGDLSAAPVIGANAGDIVGASTCAILSNPIEVSVVECCTAEATTITLNSDSNEIVCANTDTPINVTTNGGNGENSAWVITDQQTNIISTTDVPPFTFNEVGDYIIWFLNWDGDLSAVPAIGANAGDIVGASTCAILSNPIEINVVECCTAAAAVISVTGGAEMLDVCVNDEDLTTITFTLDEPGNGENSAWVITDENNIIKSVATDIPSLDLYGTDLGTMKIWYLNWDGDLSAAPNPGEDAAAIVTNSICAVLSNPVTIIKDCCCPYFIEFTEDNLNCDRGNLRIKPKLSVDPSLILDDGTLICNNNLDLISCSQNPTIFDSNDNIVSNPVTVAGDYSATIDCTCAPDVSFTLTQEKLDECNNAIPIVAPVLTVMDIADATATLTYVFDGPVTIEFRKDGDLAFEGFQSELGMAFLAGLEPCTSYDFRSKVDNGNDGVVISSVQTFTTTGCRNINIGNVNLRSLNVRATTAVLSWDNMPGCIYTFYYRVEGGNEWLNYNTSIPFVVLFGLNPCTNYEWALKISDENVESEISAAQLISTTCQGTRLSNPNATDIKIGNLTDLQNIELDLYLNPSAATLTIDYMGLPVNSASIYAANGQLVEALTISNNGLNTIDVNKLDAGVYILVSNLDAGLAKNKFVISK